MSAWNSRSVSLMSTTSASTLPLAPGMLRDLGFRLFLFGARSRQVEKETFADFQQLRQSVLRSFFHLSVLCAAPIPADCLAHLRNCQFKVMSLCRVCRCCSEYSSWCPYVSQNFPICSLRVACSEPACDAVPTVAFVHRLSWMCGVG